MGRSQAAMQIIFRVQNSPSGRQNRGKIFRPTARHDRIRCQGFQGRDYQARCDGRQRLIIAPHHVNETPDGVFRGHDQREAVTPTLLHRVFVPMSRVNIAQIDDLGVVVYCHSHVVRRCSNQPIASLL